MSKLYNRLGRILYWGIWPGSWLYLRGSERCRLLLCHKDEVLVVKGWLGIGRWVLPGGGLKKKENPVVGMLREVYEETGVQLGTTDVRLLASEMYTIHGFTYRCHYFVARVHARPTTTRRRFEIVEIGWSKVSDVSSRTHNPDVLRALELLDSAKSL